MAAADKGAQVTTQIEIIATNRAPMSVGPYSQATRAGGFIFLRRPRSASMEESVLMALRRTTSLVLCDEHAEYRAPCNDVGS